jgi:hypothetical protein
MTGLIDICDLISKQLDTLRNAEGGLWRSQVYCCCEFVQHLFA